MKGSHQKHTTTMIIVSWTITFEDQSLSGHRSECLCETYEANLVNISDPSMSNKDSC